jgi:hypothetical protein
MTRDVPQEEEKEKGDGLESSYEFWRIGSEDRCEVHDVSA